jgi:hypothetical protein
MKPTDNELDEETIRMLMRYGIFFSKKAPPVSRELALVFVAQAMLENFVKEFRSLLDKLHPDCRLKDFQASPEEMKLWFGEDWKPANADGQAPENECPPEERGHSIMFKRNCKEVDEKMQFDVQSKLEEYLKLLEQIKQKTGDERTAVSLLQEVSKDRRSAEIREERETKNSDTNSSEPATEKQKQFMKKLGIKFPATVTKQEASMLLDEELGRNGE